MAESVVVLLLLLLSCLIMLQQVNEAIMIAKCNDDYTRKWPKKRPRKRRRFWIRPGRNSGWWDNFLSSRVVEEEWKENCRMSRSSFYELCALLRPFIEHQTTHMRSPVSVETQVAVVLYYLSDEGRLRKVANAFGISHSSCSIIVRKVSQVITTHLGPHYIKLPFTEECVQEKVENFYQTFLVPQCLGAIDGTHIEIKQPSLNSSDYINRKSHYSPNIQALCDYRCCFLDVVV